MLKGLIITKAEEIEQKKSDVRTCDVSLWLDELVEVGLHEGEPLLDATFNVSATLAHITNHWIVMSVEYLQPVQVDTYIFSTSKDQRPLR